MGWKFSDLSMSLKKKNCPVLLGKNHASWARMTHAPHFVLCKLQYGLQSFALMSSSLQVAKSDNNFSDLPLRVRGCQIPSPKYLLLSPLISQRISPPVNSPIPCISPVAGFFTSQSSWL